MISKGVIDINPEVVQPTEEIYEQSSEVRIKPKINFKFNAPALINTSPSEASYLESQFLNSSVQDMKIEFDSQ
jgi:hypothetical protein